jgi:hypothetical protein
MKKNCLVRSLLVLALCAAPGFAADPPVRQTPLETLPEAVRKPLQTADQHLRRGEWEQARGLLQGVLDEESRRYRTVGFGEALWRLALAEAGLGRVEEARWRWQTLLSFSDAVPSAADLAAYGAPGEQLARWSSRLPGASPSGLAVDAAPGLQPARRVAGDLPDLTNLQGGAPPLWMRLELVIDPEGAVREPVVLASNALVLSYRVLEAVRGWRYEPARRDGKPVASFVEVDVNPLRERPFGEMVPFSGEMAEIDRLLREQKWKAARGRAEVLWGQALHNAEQTPQALGVLLALRALAEAGADKDADVAICHWQAAQSLAPPLFHADLAAYGAAGALLEANRWQRAERTPPADRPGATDAVTPPEARDRRPPDYPAAGRKQGAQGLVTLETVIVPTGAVRLPFTYPDGLGSRPNFAASTLDAVCHWRFKPATWKGQPVAVFYLLTVNYQIPKGELPGAH